MFLTPLCVSGLTFLVQSETGTLQCNKDLQRGVRHNNSKKLASFCWWPPTLHLDPDITNSEVWDVLPVQDVREPFGFVLWLEALLSQGIFNLIFQT